MRPYMISPFAAFAGNAPLGGNVNQVFDFWSEWFKSVGQIGLVNIDLGHAGDPDLERDILSEVGSYGRQIGQISDAVSVLLEQAELDRTKLSDDDICKLQKFRKMLAKIDDCKERAPAQRT